MGQDSESDEVGYGKPPKKTRFRRGTSGNPLGRPRQAPSFRSDLAAELNQTLTITENGKRITLTKQRAVFRTLTTAALKDVRAASVLLDIARKYGVGTESETPKGGDAQEDAELLDDFVQQQRKRLDHTSSDAKTSESGDDNNG
jgi:hypothetical protein